MINNNQFVKEEMDEKELILYCATVNDWKLNRC